MAIILYIVARLRVMIWKSVVLTLLWRLELPNFLDGQVLSNLVMNFLWSIFYFDDFHHQCLLDVKSHRWKMTRELQVRVAPYENYGASGDMTGNSILPEQKNWGSRMQQLNGIQWSTFKSYLCGCNCGKHSCLVGSRNIYWSLEFSLAGQAEPECRICNVFCWTGVIASI